MGRNEGCKITIFQSKWPCCLSSEEQRVGFKSHGAICGGRGFGKDQADQHIEARVAGARITALEQARDEAQQGGKEELEEVEEEEEEDHKITGTQMCKEKQTNSSNSPVQTLSWWTSPSWIPVSDLVLTCCWKSCGTKKKSQIHILYTHQTSQTHIRAWFSMTTDRPCGSSLGWAIEAGWCSPQGAGRRWSGGADGSRKLTETNSASAATPSESMRWRKCDGRTSRGQRDAI